MRIARVVAALVLGAVALATAGDEAAARLERLEILARVWSRIYFFHPRVVSEGLRWEDALVEAIPAAEAARTDAELLAAIEKTLLARIGDDAVRVFRKGASAPAPASPVGTVDARVIAPGVGLIAVREPNFTDDPAFLDKFAAAYRGLGAIEKLVVDLRWPDIRTSRSLDPTVLIRFFLDKPAATGGELHRQHTGWNERQDSNIYVQEWVVRAGLRLQPITQRQMFERQYGDTKRDTLPVIGTPSLFLVNNHSHFVLAATLDLLQRERGAAVAWEKRGGTPRPDFEAPPVKIGENLELHLPESMLLNGTGGLGLRADYATGEAIADADLPRLASELLPVKPRPASAFPLQMKFPEREPPSDEVSREQRIAGLIKLWSVVETFNPHLDKASPQWRTVLRDGIPAVESARTVREYYETLRRLTAPLNDNHVTVRHRSLPFAFATLPIAMRAAEGRVFVTRVDEALQADVKPGDEILSVDGKSVREIEETWRGVLSLSTPATLQRDIWDWGVPWAGDKELKLRLTLDRGGNRREVEIPRTKSDAFPPKTAVASRRLDHNLGYLDLSAIEEIADLEKALQDLSATRGLILDLRRGLSQGGYEIIPRLIDEPARSPNWVFPVVGSADENTETWITRSWVREPHQGLRYRNPVVVLIDENAQSFMETFCMVLRNARRVRFVGSRTAGTNGNITTVDLPGGGRMSFTGMRAVFQDGTPFQNVGILPDVEVRPTFAGLRAGRDEVLERAVEVLAATARP